MTEPDTAAHCACGCTLDVVPVAPNRVDTITALFKRLLALGFRMEKA